MTLNATADDTSVHPLDQPDITLNVREAFGLESDMDVPAFSQSSDLVPDLDVSYQFDHETTMAMYVALTTQSLACGRVSR